jgi:hypothetical protein
MTTKQAWNNDTINNCKDSAAWKITLFLSIASLQLYCEIVASGGN